MTRVKICGITKAEDAMSAAYAGAWALGFIFYKKSPRYISASRAKRIIDQLPPFVTPVGVFVNQKEGAIQQICKFTGINTLQFHGDEDPAMCKRFSGKKVIKAFRVTDDFDFRQVKKYQVDAYLFDAFHKDVYGGSGETFNWNLLKHEKIDKPYILSGGLDSTNVSEAINILKPYAVDVSSGVEDSPGIKNTRQIKTFIDTVNFRK